MKNLLTKFRCPNTEAKGNESMRPKTRAVNRLPFVIHAVQPERLVFIQVVCVYRHRYGVMIGPLAARNAVKIVTNFLMPTPT